MVKIDGIDIPEQWVAEHEMPPVSEHGISELMNWVVELEEQAAKVARGKWPNSPENVASVQRLEERAQLIGYVLRCAFPLTDGFRSEETDYFKMRLQAIRDARAKEQGNT